MFYLAGVTKLALMGEHADFTYYLDGKSIAANPQPFLETSSPLPVFVEGELRGCEAWLEQRKYKQQDELL